jgi:hypothetical protein
LGIPEIENIPASFSKSGPRRSHGCSCPAPPCQSIPSSLRKQEASFGLKNESAADRRCGPSHLMAAIAGAAVCFGIGVGRSSIRTLLTPRSWSVACVWMVKTGSGKKSEKPNSSRDHPRHSDREGMRRMAGYRIWRDPQSVKRARRGKGCPQYAEEVISNGEKVGIVRGCRDHKSGG